MLGAQALRTKQRLEHQDKVRRLKLAAKKAREMKALEESASMAITAVMAPVVIHQSHLVRSGDDEERPNSGHKERERSKSRSFTASMAGPRASTTSSSLNELSASEDKGVNVASPLATTPLGDGRPCSECMRRQSSSYTNFSRSSRKASIVEEMTQSKQENSDQKYSHILHHKKSSKCSSNAAGHSLEIVDDSMVSLKLKDKRTKSSGECLTSGQKCVLQYHKSVNFRSTCSVKVQQEQQRSSSTTKNPLLQKSTVTFDVGECDAQDERFNTDCSSSKHVGDDNQRQSRKSVRKWYQPLLHLRNSGDKKQK